MNNEGEKYGIIPGKRFCQHCKSWENFGPLTPEEGRAWARRELRLQPWYCHPRCLDDWKKELAKQCYTLGRQPGFTAFCHPSAVV